MRTDKTVNPIDFEMIVEKMKLNDVQRLGLSQALCKQGGTVSISRVQAFCGALDRSIKDKSILKINNEMEKKND